MATSGESGVMSFGKRPGPGHFGGREKRRHDRRRTNQAANIVARDGRTIPCEIIDLSSSGALLAVASVLGVPPQFRLEPHAGGSYVVEGVRREAGKVGVRFMGDVPG
jgi:hypothetical protein